jgi:hypothetical protein
MLYDHSEGDNPAIFRENMGERLSCFYLYDIVLVSMC